MHSLTTHFSYRPRSGSRVIAAQDNDHVAICHVAAGTIAVGDLVTLSMYAAVPGHHYRHDACRLASEVIPLTGGLAEDAQGTVTLAIPRHRAPEIVRLVTQLLPVDVDDLHRQLWRNSAATLKSIGRHGECFAVAEDPRAGTPLACVPGWKTRPKRDEDGNITGGTERVPALWIVDARYSGVQSDAVSEPHWVDNGRVIRAAHIAITDAGRHFAGVLDGCSYSTPCDDLAWVQIEGEQVPAALALLHLHPSAADGVDAYHEVGTHYGPDAVLWTAGGEDCAATLQVYRTAATAFCFDRLAELASQKNWHADFPVWAGWHKELCGSCHADAVA